MKPDELPSRKAYRRLPPPKHMDTWNEGATGKIPLYFKVIFAFILSCMFLALGYMSYELLLELQRLF